MVIRRDAKNIVVGKTMLGGKHESPFAIKSDRPKTGSDPNTALRIFLDIANIKIVIIQGDFLLVIV